MIFTRQGHPTMKSTTSLTLQWRLLARIARTCLSTASHFFGLRISPSCSEIFNRRRISCRSSVTDKFLGRLGKIEGFFILNPSKRYCLYFKQWYVSRGQVSSSDTDKFLGRHGKIDCFFISNPSKRYCLYFKQFRIFSLILFLKYGKQHRRSLYA